MKWHRLFDESKKTSSNIDLIDASFNGDVSDEKYTPTLEFIKNVYDNLNKELFDDRLVKSDNLKISIRPIYGDNGITSAKDNDDGSIEIVELKISSTTTLTIHTWIEVVLHEMIHIDELMYHPEHFNSGQGFEKHGKWFKEKAMEFKKMGFDVTETYDGDFGTNTNDEIYLNNKDGVFIKVSDNPLGFSELIKVPTKEKGYAFNRLRDSGYSKVWLMRTDNDNAGRLEFNKYDDDSGYSIYHCTKKFNDRFGPFEEVKEVDLKHIVAESQDGYFMPGDIIEVNTRYFKRFIRDGVRHYIII